MRPTNRTMSGSFRETISAVTTVGNALVIADYPVEMPNVESTVLRTTVTIPDHGSMLLGGLTYGLKQQTHTGIPFLSHIPFLGRLFGQDGLYDENRRMFMLVEGTIYDIEELEKAQ
jgi:type II secretory pathway component GspD/PulD (secretin)